MCIDSLMDAWATDVPQEFLEVPYTGITAETEKAFLLQFDDGQGYFVEQWVPKSIMHNVTDNSFHTYPKIAKEYHEKARKVR